MDDEPEPVGVRLEEPVCRMRTINDELATGGEVDGEAVLVQ